MALTVLLPFARARALGSPGLRGRRLGGGLGVCMLCIHLRGRRSLGAALHRFLGSARLERHRCVMPVVCACRRPTFVPPASHSCACIV